MRRRVFLGAQTLAWLNTSNAAELRDPIALIELPQPPPEASVLTVERCYLISPEPRATTAILNELDAVLRQAGRSVTRGNKLASAGMALLVVAPPCHSEPTETCVRLPLWMQLPNGQRAGQHEDSLVSSIDLLPTLLNAAKPPGRNLWPRIATGQGERAESIYSHSVTADWRLVVRGFDKLVVDRKLQPTNLYNLAADPAESTNLVMEPAQRRLRDELTAHLRDWMRRVGDGFDPTSGLKTRKGK